MSRQLDCSMVSPCPTSATIGNYTITFEGTTNNGLTWHYRARKQQNTQGDLSHFTLQVCEDVIDNANAISWVISELVDNTCIPRESGTGPNEFFQVMIGDPGTDCVLPGTPVIKFDNLGGIESVVNPDKDIENFCFEFTLPVCYTVGCTLVGGQIAGNDACCCIQGPSPTCVPCPTPGRGIRIW